MGNGGEVWHRRRYAKVMKVSPAPDKIPSTEQDMRWTRRILSARSSSIPRASPAKRSQSPHGRLRAGRLAEFRNVVCLFWGPISSVPTFGMGHC
jgi:hypothetical protein